MRDGICLQVYDAALFGEDGMVERSFSYDFRNSVTKGLIWRICNHHDWQPVTNGCHLHLDANDENKRVEFFPESKKQTFAYALHCVKNYYEGKPQEWEVNHDSTSENSIL